MQLGGAVGELLVLLGRARVRAGVQREERLMESSTAQIHASPAVNACSGAAQAAPAAARLACPGRAPTRRNTRRCASFVGPVAGAHPGRAPRSRPSRAAGLQKKKHVMPEKKSRWATMPRPGGGNRRETAKRDRKRQTPKGGRRLAPHSSPQRSLCGGGVPPSHPSLGSSVFFLSSAGAACRSRRR